MFAGIFGCLKTALEHPNAKYQDNIMAYEAAVYTCGKLNQFLSDDFYTYEVLSYYCFLKLHTLEPITNTHHKSMTSLDCSLINLSFIN